MKEYIVGIENEHSHALDVCYKKELIRCKECKNRGIVNVCPHAGYMTVGKKVNRGTDTSPYPYNYGTEIVTYCNAKDNGYCDMAERREE